VPVKVKVTLPITEQDWCEEIIVLAELNPSPLACRMQFTAAAGTAEAAVRCAWRSRRPSRPGAHEKRQGAGGHQQAVTVAASGCGM
jgi:sulfur-oxidizing protein SoxY